METSPNRPHWASRSWPPAWLAATCILLALIYCGSCLLGLGLAIIHPSITVVWPGTGVALAAILVLGYRVAAGIFLGAFLVNTMIASPAGPGIIGCLGIAAGNTMEGVLGAYLINKFGRGCRAFERPQDIFRFVLFGALFGPIVSASCGVLSLGISWENVGLRWGTWWLGNAVGALIVAPPLILWSTMPNVHDASRPKLAQIAALTFALVLIAPLALTDWLIAQAPNFSMAFVCLPLVIWVAFNFGQRGIAVLIMLLTVVAVIGMQNSQTSLYARPEEPLAVLFRRQVLLQAFLGLTAVTGLTLAAVVAERNRSEVELREVRDKLERNVEKRTADLARANEALRQDIALRQATEEKLRQAERLAAIGDMIGGLAHESRNALQQSQACLELLAIKVERWPDIVHLVMDVQKAQDHLHCLYEEVRSYAAPIKLRLELIDLGRILLESWDALANVRQGRQAHLSQEAHASALTCSADVKAMRQVFGNILENSLHACPDPVEIRATWDDTMLNRHSALRLTLTDNGPGLSPEATKRLFQPFFTTKIQGTGLGLALTRRIIEAHGGVIAVAANHKPGMEILLTLPR